MVVGGFFLFCFCFEGFFGLINAVNHFGAGFVGDFVQNVVKKIPFI